jgi:hypothetical protein
MKRVILLAAICLVSMRGTAPAPIYGSFPGLDELINGADFIVVAELLKGPGFGERDIGDGGTFEIEVLKVIKGDAKVGKRTAYLRELGFHINPPRDSAGLEQGFMRGQLYLLFLDKPGSHVHDENGKALPVDFEDENCEGDAVWISSTAVSQTGYLDLDSLKGKDVREAVVALLNHTATEQQKFAAAARAMIESRADRNTPYPTDYTSRMGR